MAAILTGFEFGKSLIDAELIDMDSLPRLDLLAPLTENEISDSVPKLRSTQATKRKTNHVK